MAADDLKARLFSLNQTRNEVSLMLNEKKTLHQTALPEENDQFENSVFELESVLAFIDRRLAELDKK